MHWINRRQMPDSGAYIAEILLFKAGIQSIDAAVKWKLAVLDELGADYVMLLCRRS